MLPAGFTYHPAFIGGEEESELLRTLEGLAFEPVRVQGVLVKRTAAHYGMRYDYDSAKGAPAPMPDFLLPVRARMAALAGIGEQAFVGAVVLRYPPGASIFWHRDHPQFGEVIAGLSLRAACRFLFSRDPNAKEPQVVEQVLDPRSAYLIRGTARWEWEHAIPPISALRYSVTFREYKRA